jgi:hypothetical protein
MHYKMLNIIDYARNDGIISRSLICLVYDNELLVKTGDMFDPFVLLKDTCFEALVAITFLLSFLSPFSPPNVWKETA